MRFIGALLLLTMASCAPHIAGEADAGEEFDAQDALDVGFDDSINVDSRSRPDVETNDVVLNDFDVSNVVDVSSVDVPGNDVSAVDVSRPDVQTPDAAAPDVEVNPCVQNPVQPPASLGLDAFYRKYIDADGIPVVASEGVADGALQKACEIVVEMSKKRPQVRAEIAFNNIRVGVIGQNQVTTDMPEYADLNEAFPGFDWNQTRGLGATLARPLVSAGEENLLNLEGDVYRGENIMVHEFSHTFFEFGLEALLEGANRNTRLQSHYDDALAAQTYANTYAATAAREYWAESVQSWFNVNLEAIPSNGIHNGINTRAELRASDPGLAAYIALFFEDDDWAP